MLFRSPVPTACAPGSYSTATNLTSQGDCTETDPGYYATQGSTVQTECSPGTSAPTSGMGMCTKCVGGKYQPSTGATLCENCKYGHYCKEGASQPVPCPERSYANTQDREAIYSNTTDPTTLKMCTPTDPGYYATAGSQDQTPCSPGTVQPAEKRGACDKCEGGSFMNASGATACFGCTPEIGRASCRERV